MAKLEYHEYSNLFPLLEGDEFATLVADIKEHGLLEPIWVYDGKILDGRNRYRACLEAKVKPEIVEYKGTDPLGFVISVNIIRRHLTVEQRALLTLAVRDILEAQTQHGGDRRSEEFSSGSQDPLGRTSDQAAKMVGIGEATACRL